MYFNAENQHFGECSYTETSISLDSQHYSLAECETYMYCVKQKISKNGGNLCISEIQATLSFSQDAVRGREIEASLSTCMEDDFPLIKPNQIMMCPVMKCGPAGATFEKQVLLEIPHSANIESAEGGKKTTIWCKHTDCGKKEIILL